jgi:hypothetical protein
MKVRLAIPMLLLFAAPLLLPRTGAALIIDFESLPAGYIVTSADLPAGVTIDTTNNTPGHPDAAIIFDSSCPGGCTGGDGDLRTPGAGVGNDTAQGKVLIIAEDVVDVGGDGLVDDPDDEQNGGVVSFTFDQPHKVISVRVIDIEAMGEFPSEILIENADGSTQTVVYLELGNNSAQTVLVPSPQPATVINFVFKGTGAIDDLEIIPACGDGILDPGEECDPPTSQGGDPGCSDECTIVPTGCGDGVVTPPEECDPPFAEGGDPGCRDDCTMAICGDGETEAGEECDPPASQGGVSNCNDDCTLSVCGDGEIEAGEDCDPPESQGGEAGCTDDCQLVSDTCGDGVVEPPLEECDPPFSQGGEPDCNDECKLTSCGDGQVEGGEECDPPFSQGGDANCSDECTLTECGDGIIEGAEDCDPPASQGGEPECNDDCMLSMCGDEEIEAGEDCDPPESQGGEPGCSDECTFVDCGDSIVQPPEECDPPFTQGGEAGCGDNCMFIVCGDGIIEPPEDCDPPASQGGDPECGPDCMIGDICGNGILDPGEECDPPTLPEICDNGIDDDFDGDIDCADIDCLPPDADPNDPPVWCGGQCTEGVCQPIKKDPAIIRFGSPPKLDFFSMHGRIDAGLGSFDPLLQDFKIMLSNPSGPFLDVTLPAGKLKRNSSKRFSFKNAAAKSQGAGADGGGMFRAAMRFRTVLGEASYTFKLRIFGDFSGAKPPTPADIDEYAQIVTQVYGAGPSGAVGFISGVAWTRTSKGWQLTLSNF